MDFETPWIGKKNLNVTGKFWKIQNICMNISLNYFFQGKYFTLIMYIYGLHIYLDISYLATI